MWLSYEVMVSIQAFERSLALRIPFIEKLVGRGL